MNVLTVCISLHHVSGNLEEQKRASPKIRSPKIRSPKIGSPKIGVPDICELLLLVLGIKPGFSGRAVSALNH